MKYFAKLEGGKVEEVSDRAYRMLAAALRSSKTTTLKSKRVERIFKQ